MSEAAGVSMDMLYNIDLHKEELDRLLGKAVPPEIKPVKYRQYT